MERKPFDQVLHDENDAIAKEAVRSFLEAVWGYPVTEGGQYDVDLLIYEEDTICGYVEVERRHNWDKQHFPFDTLQHP
jgi:fibronectin type 3 domain-containing protein